MERRAVCAESHKDAGLIGAFPHLLPSVTNIKVIYAQVFSVMAD